MPSLLEDASDSQISVWNSKVLSHVIYVFLPGFQVLKAITVNLCWTNVLLLPSWMVESSKASFSSGNLEAWNSSLFHLNPLNVLFGLVWVSVASYKLRTNTDPQTLRNEELRNFNPEKSLIHVSNVRSVLDRFQDLLKLSWILYWLLGSSGFAPGLWDYGDIALKHWAPECIPVHTEDVPGIFRGMLLSGALRRRKKLTSMNQRAWHTLALRQTNQSFRPISIHPFAAVENNPIADH